MASFMSEFEPIILLLAILLAAAGGKIWKGRTDGWDVSGGMMRIGYGLAKGLLLALPLYEIHCVCVQASSEARNGWSAFIGMLTFALLPVLGFSAIGDVFSGLGMLVKIQPMRLVRDPFWAGGVMDFWCRWGAQSPNSRPSVVIALKGLAVATLLTWRGLSEGLAAWMALHASMIMLDYWLGGRLGWLPRVPRLVQGVMAVGLYILSTPLVYMGSLAGAWEEWNRLFNPPAGTVYSLFLDRRLTTPRTCGLIWVALLTVIALPSMPWWSMQGKMVRRGAKSMGLIFLGGFVLLSGMSLTGIGRGVSSRVVFGWHGDGNNGVHRGDDGWLYPIHEIDRMTQKRQKPGLAEEVLRLKKELEEKGTKLLLLPVPDKVTLYPEPVLPAKYWVPVLHPGYINEVESLRAAEVDVLDLTTHFWGRRHSRPFYFKQDSHWMAEAMKEVAEQTARHIRKTYPQVVKDETPMVDAVFMERRDVGDLAWTLNPGYAKDNWSEEISQMVGLRGLNGGEGSPVLVIGGSLVRVFDDPRLTFGLQLPGDAPAAFPVQLGALIGRAVDVADEGLRDEYVRRSEGKKLVIWVVRAGAL
jgi:hypothetical protein